MEIETAKFDTIVDRYGGEQRALVTMLQDIQAECHYLPREAMRRVSEKMGLPLIQVYQVAKFYKAFRLEPRGEHLVTVCLGTACHVRGGARIAEQVGRLLDIAPGETTRDKQFTLETVNCLGCCALGPVVVVDGEYHGKMSANKVERLLKKHVEGDAAHGQG